MNHPENSEGKVRYRYTIDLISGILASHTSLATAEQVTTKVVERLTEKGIDVEADIGSQLTLEVIKETAAMFRLVIEAGAVTSLSHYKQETLKGIAQCVTLWEGDAMQQERWIREG